MNTMARFAFNPIKFKLAVPLDVDLSQIDWDEPEKSIENEPKSFVSELAPAGANWRNSSPVNTYQIQRDGTTGPLAELSPQEVRQTPDLPVR